MSSLRSILLLLATVAAAALMPVAGHASALADCPGESPRAQERVRQFLDAPHLAEVREQLGLREATPQRLRALAGREDEAVCRSIRGALTTDRGQLPPGQLAFYESGGFYFAAVSRPSQSNAGAARIREDSNVLFVFDREFRLVSRLLA
ncbi:hypothetical protein [Longimicrobium sp.]|uniref:hypothetical protein n=1 Tax=Longimicrobium sp. TaxID=2029185 RepID=UPI002E304783|nr:hypothetical protein [Longimicrobium sp.]HEX6041850.1 hypothetical protein [Longimicrobium sp.]